MSEKPISPLRRRMLESMAVRRLGEKTRSNYIHYVESLTAFLAPHHGKGRGRALLPGLLD